MKVHNLVVTGSLSSGGENITSISSSVSTTVTELSSSLTSSIGSLSSSMATMVTNMSSSFDTTIDTLATTGSNLFVGNQTISGSIIPAVNAAYDLGSPTHEFRDLYLSSASLYIDGTKVLGSTTQELQITTDSGQSFKILEAGSDTITLQSADGNITLASSGGGDVILDPTTGIIALKGTTTLYAGNKILSSDGNAIQFGNSVTMTGSLIVTGYIETQELRTTYISSSILYRSGSTKFGDEVSDTHSFTGSLSISGSISIPESGLVSGSSQITYSGLSGIPSGIISGSSQLPSGVVSGSVQVDVMSTTNIARLATTGSNTFNGTIRTSGVSIGVAATSNVLDVRGENNTYDGTIILGARGTIQHRDGGNTILSIANDYNSDSAKFEIRMKGNTTSDAKFTLLGSGAATFTGNLRTDGVLNWNGTNGALSYGGGAVTMETNSAIPILIKTNGTTAITVATGQTVTFASNVGLGTTPLTKLHLQDSSPNYILLTNTGADGVANAIQGGIIGQARGYSNNLAQMASILFRNENSAAWYKGEITFNTNGTDGTDPSVSPIERVRITSGGLIGIGDSSPQSGIYLAKYGSNWDGDSQYTKPTGNVFLSMGYSVSNAHNWFGIRGNYGSSSGTANILLQANYRDIGSQAGHYITSTATGLGTAYFAIGKLETTTSVGTPPNKIEQLIITRAGTLQIKPNTIGTSDTSDRSIIIGSRPSSSSIASLGFDTGGTYRGDFDFSSSDGNLSWWSYNGSSWSEKWRSTPSSGFNIYNSALSLTETGVSSFSISYSSGKTQFGMDSAGTDGFYFRSYSGGYADRFIIKSSGEVNVRGNIFPVSDATYNLGSTSLRWNNLYTTDLHLSNEGKQNIVDGTWGDWTLQEGENDIFMINNRNGEKFKIKLEKIEI